MVYVVKVKYGDTLRRFTFESKPRGEDLSYSGLESRIRRLFDLPAGKQIRVTYNDRDNDVITMADDQDLVDALIMQSLNPLRLYVTAVEPKSMSLDIVPATPTAAVTAAVPTTQQSEVAVKETADVPFKQMLKGQIMKGFTVFHEGGVSLPQDLVENIVKMVTTQVSAAVKGAEAKSRSVGEVLSGLSEATKVGNTPIAAFPLPRPSEASSSSIKSESHEAAAVEPKQQPVNRVFHTGVTCDVCGTHPIEGARFKSKKKYDYDLCSNCFNKADDQADYDRIERPLFRPRHLHFGGSGRMRCPALYSNHHQGRHMSMSGPYTSRPSDRWHQGPVPQIAGAMYAGKLDSRFVEDVTIMDGTEMAQGTRFTKIWRLRNSGKIPWAPQTKLVHVGGDALGSVIVVPLDLPEHGLLPDQEVEAAVDLTAPPKPGRYVSHWRLASPAGQKFGHRVWVVIQVVSKENTTPVAIESAESDADKSQDDEVTEKTPLLITATPAAASSSSSSHKSREDFVKASHSAIEHSEGKITYPEVDMTSSFVDILEPFSGLKISEVERDTEVKEDGLVTVSNTDVKVELPTENVAQAEAAAVENSELGGGFSMVEMPSNGNNVVNSIPTPSEEVQVLESKQDETVEVAKQESVDEQLNTPERLSVKLEAMGFSDRKLNVELLVSNNLDLRRTLDDLFAAAEWDPILEELEEMGFYDTEMNRRLMFKNKGSVKRVVKELVQLYKEPANQGKAKGVDT
ncbi:unnamed protein product [Calypogeia fissa]